MNVDPYIFAEISPRWFELSLLKRKDLFVLIVLEINNLVFGEFILREGTDTTPSEILVDPL